MRRPLTITDLNINQIWMLPVKNSIRYTKKKQEKTKKKTPQLNLTNRFLLIILKNKRHKMHMIRINRFSFHLHFRNHSTVTAASVTNNIHTPTNKKQQTKKRKKQQLGSLAKTFKPRHLNTQYSINTTQQNKAFVDLKYILRINFN